MTITSWLYCRHRWLSYVQNKLALAYRTRLTWEVMKQYLGDERDPNDVTVFYKLGECAQF